MTTTQAPDDVLAPQPITAPDGYPEVLGELLTTLHHELRAAGLDITSANDIAWRATERIRDAWGGQIVYVPQGAAFNTRQRYEDIWRDFTGKNVPELARRYNLSEQAVYAAIRLMREEVARRNQMSLPLADQQ